MEVFEEIQTVREAIQASRKQNRKIGLVPTMGNLHEGHMELTRQCLSENDVCIASIYVNPTQFNNPSDLQNYPRSFEKDLKLLKASGCNMVFAPGDKEMYPGKAKIKMDFGDLDKVMEGKFRPGHFNGVAVVVAKLLNIILPDKAYFGEKDLQQLFIVRQLVRDLNFGTEIVGVPTVRESSGLAMSSRNNLLDPQSRREAGIIYEALIRGKAELLNGKSLSDVIGNATILFSEYPNVRLEYLEMVDLNEFRLIEDISNSRQCALCIAAYVGEVRLIDNMIIEIDQGGRLPYDY